MTARVPDPALADLSQRKRSLPRFALTCTAAVVVTFVTFLPLCNQIFHCGCTFAGTGHCNVHHASGTKCPYCAHGNGSFAVAYGLIVAGIAGAVAIGLRMGRGHLVTGFIAGLIGYGLTAGVVGLMFALHYHYPTWFGLHLAAGG